MIANPLKIIPPQTNGVIQSVNNPIIKTNGSTDSIYYFEETVLLLYVAILYFFDIL